MIFMIFMKFNKRDIHSRTCVVIIYFYYVCCGAVTSRFGEVASLSEPSTDALSEKSAVYGYSLNVYA